MSRAYLFTERLFSLKVLNNVINEEEEMLPGIRVKLFNILNTFNYLLVKGRKFPFTDQEIQAHVKSTGQLYQAFHGRRIDIALIVADNGSGHPGFLRQFILRKVLLLSEQGNALSNVQHSCLKSIKKG